MLIAILIAIVVYLIAFVVVTGTTEPKCAACQWEQNW